MANRNLFCVQLIDPEVPEDLSKRYWLDVEEQVTRLEKSFGQVCKLYHEANYLAEEDGLKNLQRVNEKAFQLINNKVDAGASVQALEDKESFLEIFDCQLFLTLRFSSKEVTDKVSKITPEILQVYEQAIQKRREYIPKQILNTLNDGETGILLMSEGERMKIQFPSEVNVILVMPPVISEIERWQRGHQHSDSPA
jgi:hypothetical protein